MTIKRTMWITDNRSVRFRKQNDDFQVRKVKNHIYPEIDEFLSETVVNQYINRGWDVIIERRKK